MMKDLYYGKAIPWERRNRLAAEQHEIVRQIDAEESYFDGILSAEDQQRFKALTKLYSELSMSSEVEIFSCGFSMGLILMAEAANEAKNLTPRDLRA